MFVDEEGYVTHLLRDEAVRLIENHRGDGPWFLHLSFTAPHTPLQAPQATVEAYAGIADGNRRRLAAMVTELDSAIESVLGRLEPQRGRGRYAGPVRQRQRRRIGRRRQQRQSQGGQADPVRGRGCECRRWLTGHPACLAARRWDQFVTVYDWLPTLLNLAGHSDFRDEAHVGP